MSVGPPRGQLRHFKLAFAFGVLVIVISIALAVWAAGRDDLAPWWAGWPMFYIVSGVVGVFGLVTLVRWHRMTPEQRRRAEMRAQVSD